MTRYGQRKKDDLVMKVLRIGMLPIIFFMILMTFRASAQVDTLATPAEEVDVDTVRVKKKIIVNKVVYLPELPKTNRLFFSVYGGLYGDKSYYKVCDVCQEYYNQVQAATSPAVSYEYGIDLAYSPKKWVFTFGASHMFNRSRFSFTDSTGRENRAINRLNYVSANLYAGYWFNKDRQGFSYQLMAGPSWQWLSAFSGLTLRRSNPRQVVELKEEMDYYPTNITVNAMARVFYSIQSRIYIYAGIFYNYDIRSIVRTEQIVQQRNIFGLNIGLTYQIR
jgi:hypothetical protein